MFYLSSILYISLIIEILKLSEIVEVVVAKLL